jgi:hypothetical protein
MKRTRPTPVPDNRICTLAELLLALSRLRHNLQVAGYLEEAVAVERIRENVRNRAKRI